MSEQTASEKTDAPDTGAEATTVQDDLDKLLKEYDTSTKPAPTPQPKQKSALEMWAERKMVEEQMTEVNSSIDNAVQAIKGGLQDSPVQISDELIEGYLHREAFKNPKVKQAFENRAANPATWTQTLTEIGASLKDVVSVDPNANAGRQAVEAAVKGSKTTETTEEAPNYAAMSDEEFMKATSGI